MNFQSELKAALNHYFSSGDTSKLQSVISAHSDLVSTEYGEYPDFHRIVDIQIGSGNFRVCRQISQGEMLTLLPVNEALDMPGVPLWLEGEKLRGWARNEEENPSDGPTNWDQYR